MCYCCIISFCQELCCDDTLRVTVTKVIKPKELVLVLFLTNQKQTNLVDVITSVNTSSNLEAKLTNPHDSNSFLDQLSSFATVRNLCLELYDIIAVHTQRFVSY